MDDGVEPAALQPVHQFGRRHEIGELALGQIAPFAVMAEHVAHRHVAAAGVVQRGHDVRSDKTGAPGHQQHAVPCHDCAARPLPQSRPAGNLASSAVVTGRIGPALPAAQERLPTGPKSVSGITSRYEYKFIRWDRDGGCRRHPADPDRSLYVDRRLRPRPHGGAGAEAALAEPAGRSAGDLPLRAAGRLHAGRPRRDRLGPAPQPAGGGQAMGSGGASCAPGATEPPWSCPAPGRRRLRRRWPASRSGSAFSARRGSG